MPPWRVAMAGVLLAAMLAGCTAEPDAPPSPEPTVTADAPADVNASARETLADGGTLRLRLRDIPAQWNPDHPDGATADLRALTEPLTSPTFVLDAAGRATPNPDVVTTAEVSHAGHTRVTLHLNPEARWGDGAPVTAEDWIATWQGLSGRTPGVNPVSTRRWADVTAVTAGADAHTVVVDFDGVVPDWAEPLAPGVHRAASVADADAFAWSSFDPARYAGPFTVTHVDAHQGVVTLERNPQWWGDAPRLTRIVFRTLGDAVAPAAFRNNELDLLDVGADEAVGEKVRGATDATVRQAPAPTGRLLRLDRDGPLGEAAVRRALLLGTDRDALARTEVSGLAAPVRVWSDPLLLPNQPGYADQALATGLGWDAERARAELAAAGWTLTGAGGLARDGDVLALTMAVPADDPGAATEFELLAEQWGALGVRLEAVETADAAAAAAADVDIVPVEHTVGAFPLAHLPAAADPALAEHVVKVASETDVVRRVDQANQLSRLLWEDVATIPLYQEPQVVAVRNRLANVGAGGFATTAWEDVGWQS